MIARFIPACHWPVFPFVVMLFSKKRLTTNMSLSNLSTFFQFHVGVCCDMMQVLRFAPVPTWKRPVEFDSCPGFQSFTLTFYVLIDKVVRVCLSWLSTCSSCMWVLDLMDLVASCYVDSAKFWLDCVLRSVCPWKSWCLSKIFVLDISLVSFLSSFLYI